MTTLRTNAVHCAPSTRQEVLEYLRECGWQPNDVASPKGFSSWSKWDPAVGEIVEVLVPEDETRLDYRERLAEAVSILAEFGFAGPPGLSSSNPEDTQSGLFVAGPRRRTWGDAVISIAGLDVFGMSMMTRRAHAELVATSLCLGEILVFDFILWAWLARSTLLISLPYHLAYVGSASVGACGALGTFLLERELITLSIRGWRPVATLTVRTAVLLLTSLLVAEPMFLELVHSEIESTGRDERLVSAICELQRQRPDAGGLDVRRQIVSSIESQISRASIEVPLRLSIVVPGQPVFELQMPQYRLLDRFRVSGDLQRGNPIRTPCTLKQDLGGEALRFLHQFDAKRAGYLRSVRVGLALIACFLRMLPVMARLLASNDLHAYFGQARRPSTRTAEATRRSKAK